MLPPQQSFQPSRDQLINFCMAEFTALEAVTKSAEFPEIIKRLRNYPAFLRSRAKLADPMKMILDASKGSRIIEVASMTPAVRELMYTAHFAACCILLDGYRLDLNKLRTSSILPMMQQKLASSFEADSKQLPVITQRMVGMDATRTIQLLRVFGLITRQSSEMYQIGLGAGNGEKDINFVHTIPSIRLKGKSVSQKIAFGSSLKQVADIIINDLDPMHQDKFEQLSKDTSKSVTGYVSDTHELLKKLASSDIRKRNLVTCLRIEPAMIPDAGELLRNLHPIIDESCDFVLTIGAGDTPDAYQRRLDVVNDMFARLEEAQLKPVLFRFHLGGNIQQQGSSIQFGSIAASSYETLYCRLNKEALAKIFSD